MISIKLNFHLGNQQIKRMRQKHQRSMPTLKEYLTAYKVDNNITANMSQIHNDQHCVFYKKILELKLKIRSVVRDKKTYAEIDNKLQDLYLTHKDLLNEESREEMKSLQSTFNRSGAPSLNPEPQKATNNSNGNISQLVLKRQKADLESKLSKTSNNSFNCFDQNESNVLLFPEVAAKIVNNSEMLKSFFSTAKQKKGVSFDIPESATQIELQDAQKCVTMQKKLFHKIFAE